MINAYVCNIYICVYNICVIYINMYINTIAEINDFELNITVIIPMYIRESLKS